MLVILLNCVTLGMFQPCEDSKCISERCRILQDFDDFIFAFFAVEMVIKMVALGIFGKKCYLGDTWNRLDFFIVLAGMLEYSLNLQNVSFSAVRTVRVLRPLRAINRVPSMRILVTLLLDTLPMLGNVLLLCFFVFFIFGIVGVQLWAGRLRNRCFLPENVTLPMSVGLQEYFHTENDDENPFICSKTDDDGMRHCNSLPKLQEDGLQCQLDYSAYNSTDNTTCVNWNNYYTNCFAGANNPFKGAINFDNIGYAWIAIFQVITLEGWVDIMYFVMDAHSFYNFIYFILLIVVGSFFMVNLCLVVIATQFSETKQRESQLMKEQRVRFMSNASTLASFSEPGSCYDELLKYLVYVVRKGTRQLCQLAREAALRTGLRVRAAPVPEQPSHKRRRRKHAQGSVHLVHHHHHHYHLGNGSVPPGRPGPELGDVETGSLHNGAGRLVLPPSPAPGSESVRSVYHADCHIEPPRPSPTSALGPASAPVPARQGLKRNSMPCTLPTAPKNYPTLHPSSSLEQPIQRALTDPSGSGCGTSILTNLNIPPPAICTTQCLVETYSPTGKGLCKFTATNCSSSNIDTSMSFDPESCPYCAKSACNDSDGTDGNETHDSDSEGVYEFTQDAHYRDSRDPNKERSIRTKLGVRTKQVLRFWRMVCNTFRKIVDSKYFGRGIMIAILINTLSMGIEFHEQPDELTNALEISNIVFTSLFALEMLLKVLVYGPFGYIKNPYNIFDGIIVVISVWEIVGQQGGGLSVLRTFRLMRVLKLVRFMPALQRQLVVLMKTMDNVATFCMLLMLFIFIFSILGMHLFGCKFGSERDGDTLPDRKNFDSLLWAIVTVFQILTQEDWNKVLYNGMASTSPWAALYFIALMTFGNYALFNLLVAILVEGFQTEEIAKREDMHGQLSCIQLPVDSGGDASKSESEADVYARSMEDMQGSKKDVSASSVVPSNGHVDMKTSLTPPLITHTAATPMPLPRCQVTVECTQLPVRSLEHGQQLEQPAVQLEQPGPGPQPQEAEAAVRGASLAAVGGGPVQLRRGRGGGTSEGDDASLSRTDSLHQHRRMESLETKSSFELPPDTLQVPSYLYRSASMHSTRPPNLSSSDCNGKSSPSAALPPQLSLDDPHSEDDNADDEVNMSRKARLFRWFETRQPEWCRQRNTWSLYLFPPQSRFRVTCSKIIKHKMFDHIVLSIIFLNCITIAMERPRIDPTSAERIFLRVSNYIFTSIFVAEMTVKVAALGFCLGQNAYLKSSWNMLDGMLVMISVIDILVSMISDSGTTILGMLRVLRLLRTLRPLRVISRAPGLKLVVETLMSSLKPIGNIVVICCAFFIIFGILGVQLFKGKFFVCDGENIRNITNRSDCVLANYKWIRRKYNFDNLGQALMSLFVLASKDGWVDIMYDGLDAVGVNQQPVVNYNPWMLLYFISFLLIVAFFVLNMFVGVVVENFHKCRRHQEAEEAKRREEKRLKRMEKKRRNVMLRRVSWAGSGDTETEAQTKPYYSDYSPTRLLIHKMCTSHYLDLFITVVIGLNVITMAMEHYQEPERLSEALKICNYIFTLIFVLESVFKLVAFGFRRFLKDRWNQLDLAIVLLSIMGITLEEIEVKASLPINPTIIRIMRVLRIARVLKLLKMAVGMQALLDTVMQALPQVGNLGLLFLLLFFIFAALGVELFGELICDEDHRCEGLGRYATFKNFGMALFLLFRVSTGDNWNGIMKDTLRDCAQEEGLCYNTVVSPLYFVSFVLTAQFVLVNVVIAVLMKHLEESNKEAKEEAELEAELELEMQLQAIGGEGGPLSPLALGEGMCSGGPSWMSGELQDRGDSPASPPADIPRDPAHITADSSLCLEPPFMMEVPDDSEQLEENLLGVRKTLVGRTHSLPNDSYMFLPVQIPGAPEGPHKLSSHRAQSGSSGSLYSQPKDPPLPLPPPNELLQPISPHSLSDSENIPRIPPPQRTHSFTRTLRRQVAVATDSQEALYAEESDAAPELRGLPAPPAGLTSPQQPAVLLVPATPGASPKSARSSVHTQHNPHDQYNVSKSPPAAPPPPSPPPGRQDEDAVDQEVSRIIRAGLGGSAGEGGGGGRGEGRGPCLRGLKKFHSADTQGRRALLPRPASWLDDPRRHSVEVCSSAESSPQRSSVSSGFVSRADSLQQAHMQPSPRRKKKMSPPCISVDPPEGREQPADSCLRRRAPSSDSKDSFDLSGGDGPPPDPKLLTLPSFCFEQTSGER
ncbi:hypothetical protein COCON_G00027320 [Conger conger]|uniref:Voltage-dependent T-type calcium channel subunit alpha n=1 Tax=Conger conger TaxID=82655 RepID=A0A9Q1DY12_CONCO|nr:hypothetical protein COCON_G00027320 [Conger conger]